MKQTGGLRVAIAQTNPALGDLEQNKSKAIEVIRKAKKQGADLVVFPELALTGYFLKDLVPEVAVEALPKSFKELAGAASGMDILISFVERFHSEHYISAAYLMNSAAPEISSSRLAVGRRGSGEDEVEPRIIHLHRKVHLPNYGIFQDKRFFHSGEAVEAFDAPFGRAGILICEDAWFPTTTCALMLKDVDYLFILSSSPEQNVFEPELSNSSWWERILRVYAKLFGVYIIFVNRVGFEDGIAFSGSSRVVDPYGNVVLELLAYEEDFSVFTCDPKAIIRARETLPLKRDLKPHILLSELERRENAPK